MLSLLLSFQTLRVSFSMAFFWSKCNQEINITVRFVHGNRNATAFPCPVMSTEMAEPGVGENTQKRGWGPPKGGVEIKTPWSLTQQMKNCQLCPVA